MRAAKKLYCRTVQMILRASMPILPYRKPVELPEISCLPEVLRKEGAERVLLITDQEIRRQGLCDSLERTLAEADIHCAVYDGTVANPTDVNVEEARALYLREGCQALIGFGGGSSMDCAKAVGARIAKPHQRLEQMEGVLRVHHRLPPLIAIPTTAGTGSETTLAAVVTDHETHHKYPITDFSLIPRYAVLDPDLTRSMPRQLTACTAMDALTHAVEAYIGRSTTRETRADATAAVRLIFQNLDRAYQNGEDLSARRNLLKAAYLAGAAFSKSYVGYVHAVAHSLSGKYDLPHGYVNAVLLPHVLEAYGSVIHGKLAELAEAAGMPRTGDNAADAGEFIQAIRSMNCRFEIPDCIPEIRREDLPELVQCADREGNPLYPVPVLMDGEELEGLYKLVMEETYERRTAAADAPAAENVFFGGKDPVPAKSEVCPVHS